jgi:predicted RNA binding protein YcfA (HicA-like mRNA interferase family)
LTIGQNCPNIGSAKARELIRKLIRKLRKHGVEFIKGRGKGGHQLARYRGKQTTIPVHGDADLGPQFVKKLCKQLGVNLDDIL